MLEFIKSRTVANYISLASAVLAIVMAIVFCAYSSKFDLFNVGELLCILLVAAVNIVMFVHATPIDEYLKVAASLLAGLSMALFVVIFIGDITDYFNNVNFMGRGASMSDIVTITVFLAILLVLQVVESFFGKSKKQG